MSAPRTTRPVATGRGALLLLLLLLLTACGAAPDRVAAPSSSPSPSPSPSTKPVGRLLVIGDSFTQGYAAPGDRGYAQLLAASLGWPAEIDGVGSTGFLWPGPDGRDRTYRARIEARGAAGGPAPTLVVLQGGLNDYRSPRPQLTAAVEAQVGLVRAAWPQARIVLFGPVSAYQNNPDLRPLSAALALASLNAGVDYVDPVGDGWVTASNSPSYFIDDGTHPNGAGHAYLAKRLLAELTEIGATRVAA